MEVLNDAVFSASQMQERARERLEIILTYIDQATEALTRQMAAIKMAADLEN